MENYAIFVRNWWKWEQTQYGKKKVPHPRARKTYIGHAESYEEAQKFCQEYNAAHEPGELSRKAEFERC